MFTLVHNMVNLPLKFFTWQIKEKTLSLRLGEYGDSGGGGGSSSSI